jgi:peptidoglycan hydrolase-like protein with peptidoglycan-binding domain
MSTAEPTPPTGPTPQELKSAMKAFRKRLKLTQLDDQSRIGRSPLSGGHASAIVGIVPPDQFRPAVWEELARQGKLKRAGNGMYALGQP